MELTDIYTKFLECNSVSIDTRKIEENSFFIALKGDNFDANQFTNEALEKGAKYVVIDNPDYQIDQKTILVNNCLELLQKLANHHRRTLKTPIIALTGSNGKTTTKELINSVLSKKYNTIATIGNLNNHIGVPLTLLRLRKETEIGIIEMGANHQKEINFLCSIAEPDYGYITNFGKAHLDGFGGYEGVIKGKSEMYYYLTLAKKTVFVNIDDPIQKEKTQNLNKFSFSFHENADVIFSKMEANPMVSILYNDNKINSNLIGIYNATNICAAISIGKYFKVSESDIKDAIEGYIPSNNRSQIINKNNLEIILDAYNANPSSMSVAINNLSQLNNINKTAILGDMFELGNESLSEHKKIILQLENIPEINAYLIGKDFYSNKIESKSLRFFETFEDFSNYLIKHPINNGLLLIKGSRGMSLERTLELL